MIFHIRLYIIKKIYFRATNQYLEFINKNIDQIKLSADYLVMASLLAYLKSKLLLPNEDEDNLMRLKKILISKILVHYDAIKNWERKFLIL